MTRLGRHPTSTAAWREHAIGELCREDRTIIEPGSPEARSLPFLGLEHIESGTGRILLPVTEPRPEANGNGHSMTFRFGDAHVLYGKLRPYLNKVAVPDFAGRCTTELIPLLPTQGVSRRFLAWLLRHPSVVDAAMRERTGARMPRANLRHVLALRVHTPEDVVLQEQIAKRLDAALECFLQARQACTEQMRLLDSYMTALLRSLPLWPDR